jgi:uncharacterized protein (TIGR02246 family)
MSTTTQAKFDRQGQTAGFADPISDPARIHQRFCEACNAGDLDRLLALYESGAAIVERTGEIIQGTDAIRQHLSGLLAMRPAMEILNSKTAVVGELAQLSSHWRCRVIAPDGAPAELEYHGSELSRRQPDGSWRIAIDNPWGAGSTIG